jgi:hypothetical protein
LCRDNCIHDRLIHTHADAVCVYTARMVRSRRLNAVCSSDAEQNIYPRPSMNNIYMTAYRGERSLVSSSQSTRWFMNYLQSTALQHFQTGPNRYQEGQGCRHQRWIGLLRSRAIGRGDNSLGSTRLARMAARSLLSLSCATS